MKELTFTQWLERLADNYGDRPALQAAERISFRELLAASRRCSALLRDAGLEKGEKVILWSFNSLEWVVAFFGIIMAGGVAVLMNYALNAAEVTGLAAMTGAQWGIIGKNKVSLQDMEAAGKALEDANIPAGHILVPDGEGFCLVSPAGTGTASRGSAGAEAQNRAMHEPRDTQLMIFTTGTTSTPKAVELSSYSVLSDMYSFEKILKEDMTASLCDALPLFHSYGLLMMLTWLDCGGCVCIPSSIKAQEVLDMIVSNRTEALATVGAIYSSLLQVPDFDDRAAGLLKTCFAGGGLTTPTEMMRIENALKGGKLLVGYGQTECSPVISVNISADPLERRAVSVGRVLPDMDVRIWRKEEGFLPDGEIGEIVVKGPNTMNGYLGLPREQQPFDEDGWLHTGDLGMIDEFGLLRLAGRIKDIIIRSGENISPLEIENAIMENPDIRAAKVFGAPHAIWGESVEACVISGSDPLDEESLRAFLKEKLSPYKIPSHFIPFRSFPLNSNGKLDQRMLKAEMMDRLKRIHIENMLNEGLILLSTTIGNRRRMITPVCDMVQGFIRQIEFDAVQVNRIRLAVEEMLTERIDNAYDEKGLITLDVIFLPDRLRVRFTDSGRQYRLDDEGASISARIILANVDAYSSAVNDSNLLGSNLDWQYAEGFDVKAFLMK